MLSIEGSEGLLLSSLKGPERPIALRLLLRDTGAPEVYHYHRGFTFIVPSPFEASSPPRIQSAHIPQKVFIKTSTRLYRTRFYEICGTGKSSAVVYETRRSKHRCSRGRVFGGYLTRFLDQREFRHCAYSVTLEIASVGSVDAARRKRIAISS